MFQYISQVKTFCSNANVQFANSTIYLIMFTLYHISMFCFFALLFSHFKKKYIKSSLQNLVLMIIQVTVSMVLVFGIIALYSIAMLFIAQVSLLNFSKICSQLILTGSPTDFPVTMWSLL